MRILLILLLLISSYFKINAQTNIDSLENLIAKTRSDTKKVTLLVNTSHLYVNFNPDRAMQCAEQALLLSKSLHYAQGEVQGLNEIGITLFATGNYAKALKISIQALKQSEEIRYVPGIEVAYNNMGNVYKRQLNNEASIQYFLKAKEISETMRSDTMLSNVLSNIGSVYLNADQTDSALYYLNSAYQLALKVHLRDISLIYCRLGDLQHRLKNVPLALEYYSMGVANAKETKIDRWLCFNYVSLAELYQKENKIDSGILYAKKALVVANNKYLQQMLQATGILYAAFEKQNKADSSLKYLQLKIALKDSILSNREEVDIQTLNFEERLRQQQIEEERYNNTKERRQNLQYAAIAVALITFIILFFLLSRSIIVKTKFIEFFGVLGLLAVFEFINLFIHPYLSHATNDSPVLMLVVLIAIGALLIPLHHRLEKWITKIMVEKNKKIRLEAAKKTIASLEREK